MYIAIYRRGLNMAIIGLVVVAVVGIFVTAITQGYVLSVLWGWFLVPLGAPSINIPTAIGIALVVSMLTTEVRPEEDTEVRRGKTFKAFLYSIFLSLVGLGMGWVIQLFL
jgi:hypothetical protein